MGLVGMHADQPLSHSGGRAENERTPAPQAPSSSPMTRHARLLLWLLFAAPAVAQQVPDDTPKTPVVLEAGIADDTGWTALVERLGAGNVPDGSGIVIAMAEANTTGYKPDPNHAEFVGKLFALKSGATGVSGHATTVARHFFGLTTSIAPGLSNIRCFSATGFMAGASLGGSNALVMPKNVGWKVQNNSWIGGGSRASG